MTVRKLVGWSAAVLACLAAVACGSAETAPPAPAASHVRSHIVVIVMENEEQESVVGSPSAPYINSLAQQFGLATESYAIRHPSLPNYLALTSGSTHGVTSDCLACHVGGRNLADQIEDAGLSWKSYLEGLPRPCFKGPGAGRYAKRHDPFAYYDDIAADPTRCRRRTTFAQLDADLRDDRLPQFALVVPDVCHDMHDCGVPTGDRFLSRLVPRLLRRVGPRGFVVLTFDEGSTNAGCCGGSRGGKIPTIVAGPDVAVGARLDKQVDHYGVLRTIEDAMGLPHLGAAQDPRHGTLAGIFNSPPRIGR
jgi:phosphatidylinositol-3-phosphatase